MAVLAQFRLAVDKSGRAGTAGVSAGTLVKGIDTGFDGDHFLVVDVSHGFFVQTQLLVKRFLFHF